MAIVDPIHQLQFSIEIVATLSFALSGLIAAARKKLDPVGLCMVSGVAAFGGGTLRDILLDRRPFFWIENSYWLWLLLGLVIVAMLLMRGRHLQLTERAIQIPDALGLGLFTALGTQIALEHGLPGIAAVLMGVVTAVFGGVLRDLFCNELPKAFSDHQPYAVFAFLGGGTLVIMNALGVADSIGLIAAFGITALLRVLALLRGWRVPAWRE
ncbi:MAG: trimeric intracellular cation channel family protein [Burkholderiaceae bacterium]|nr:trimeric intracellular cation channel family protein [Burkholderiaceae bacterium]